MCVNNFFILRFELQTILLLKELQKIAGGYPVTHPVRLTETKYNTATPGLPKEVCRQEASAAALFRRAAGKIQVATALLHRRKTATIVSVWPP